jgi:hypothetical protein
MLLLPGVMPPGRNIRRDALAGKNSLPVTKSYKVKSILSEKKIFSLLRLCKHPDVSPKMLQ